MRIINFSDNTTYVSDGESYRLDGKNHNIQRIDKKAAMTMLIQQSYRPSDPVALRKTLELVDRLSNSVALYKLGCNKEPEAAQVAYAGMN